MFYQKDPALNLVAQDSLIAIFGSLGRKNRGKRKPLCQAHSTRGKIMQERLHHKLLLVGTVICFAGYLPEIWNVIAKTSGAALFSFEAGQIDFGKKVAIAGATIAVLGFFHACRHIAAQRLNRS